MHKHASVPDGPRMAGVKRVKGLFTFDAISPDTGQEMLSTGSRPKSLIAAKAFPGLVVWLSGRCCAIPTAMSRTEAEGIPVFSSLVQGEMTA